MCACSPSRVHGASYIRSYGSLRLRRLRAADLFVCLHPWAADFIKDDQDRWWMLQLKSFRLTPECEAHMAKLSAAKMVGFCCCPREPRGRNRSSCTSGDVVPGCLCARGGEGWWVVEDAG